MRLDPKYFNIFIMVVAVIAALVIVFFTFMNKNWRESAFKRQLSEADSLTYRYMHEISSGDSLRIRDFQGSYVVLDFWSSLSPPSRASHQVLAQMKRKHSSSLFIIAAASQEPVSRVKKYMEKKDYPFLYVDGRRMYKRLQPPGIPTQITFGPDGSLFDFHIGYSDSTMYEKLKEKLSGRSH